MSRAYLGGLATVPLGSSVPAQFAEIGDEEHARDGEQDSDNQHPPVRQEPQHQQSATGDDDDATEKAKEVGLEVAAREGLDAQHDH